MVRQIASSAYVVHIVPDSEPDVKLAVELGLSILLDKPLVLLAWPGRPVPRRLRRCADHVIEMEHDPDTEAGEIELINKLRSVTGTGR